MMMANGGAMPPRGPMGGPPMPGMPTGMPPPPLHQSPPQWPSQSPGFFDSFTQGQGPGPVPGPAGAAMGPQTSSQDAGKARVSSFFDNFASSNQSAQPMAPPPHHLGMAAPDPSLMMDADSIEAAFVGGAGGGGAGGGAGSVPGMPGMPMQGQPPPMGPPPGFFQQQQPPPQASPPRSSTAKSASQEEQAHFRNLFGGALG